MQAKLKLCQGPCGELKPIWKNVVPEGETKSIRLCRQCASDYTNKPTSTSKPKNPIKKVADKRAKQIRAYNILKEEYFKTHPVCQYPGCHSTEVTLHHMQGRENELLLDDSKFLSLCWPHHDLIGQDSQLAFKLKLSISKHKKAS